MNLNPKRVLAARIIAVVADALQIGILPLFAGGALSAVNDAVDVVVAVAMIALVGWHWAFIPAFIAELVPVLDLVPTWTAAALLATRQAPRGPSAGEATGALPPAGA